MLKQNNVPGNVRTLEMNPVAPKLKGLVKLHKADRPMRPLVNCIQSPCYKIAKFVATFLKENYILGSVFEVEIAIFVLWE